MASLHLVRNSDSVTVSISNPQPVEPLRTVANQMANNPEMYGNPFEAMSDEEIVFGEWRTV